MSTVQRRTTPPIAERRLRIATIHGDRLVDNYFWLRDKEDPRVIAHLMAENAHTAAGTKHTAALEGTLYKEFLGRIKESDRTVPYLRDGYWYYSRTERGMSYPIYCRKRGTLEEMEEVVLDQNVLAAGKKFHGLGGLDVSPDGLTLLYIEDLTGFREYTLHVKDLARGEIIERIPDVWNGTAWGDDNRTFFYVRPDSAKRANTVWRHVIGTPPAHDTRVFEEHESAFTVSVLRCRSRKYIFIRADGFASSEWWAIPAATPGAVPRVIVKRRLNVEYSVEHGGGFVYILTNDSAPNFRILRAPDDDQSFANWTEWVSHRADVFLESLDVFGSFVVLTERRGGLRRLRVVSLEADRPVEVTFPEEAYGVFPTGNYEFESQVFRFTYSSPVTPSSLYEYNMRTGERELKKRQEIPNGFDPSGYSVHRRTARARDGVEVPISVLMRNGTVLDGRSALLLYAYGAYGATTEPTFNPTVLSLVDRGMIYAIAHVRGGQEMGRGWHADGRLMMKKNTFHDFIDAAEYLVRTGYSTPDRLVAFGGSAGGLLMGAVANMRPDLFKAIIADVPFVDVVNTMLDMSLPLTAQDRQEWGDPNDPKQYEYMRSYSPYDNVERRAYPWLLVTTALNDSQVMYWEPAKWVAKLREMKTDSNPLYLKVNFAGGHGGSSGRYDRLGELAFRYAFILDAVGLAESAA